MRELDKVLDSNEKVLWEDKTKFWPYFLTGFFPSLMFGVIWMAFLLPFIGVNFIKPETPEEISGIFNLFFFTWNVFLIPFFAVGFWLIFGWPLYKIFNQRNLYYAITDKRVIVQKGIIGRDFDSVDFDQITNAEVNVGFWDKVLKQNTGTILISTAGSFVTDQKGNIRKRPYEMHNIEDPYAVFKMFKKVSHDVKTDIQYPNKLRPSENPGYKTKYKPEDK